MSPPGFSNGGSVFRSVLDSVLGSVSAPGEVVVNGGLKELEALEVPNNVLHLCILQERMDILTIFLNWFYYVRWRFWRYNYDSQAKKRIYRCSIKGRGSRDDTHGWVLKHDSIIVKIDDRKWIKAEKGGVEREMNLGGIRIYPVTDHKAPVEWEDPGDEGPGRYSVRFECVIKLGEGMKLTAGEVTKLLRSSDCDKCYNALSANCWKYANSRARAVLEWAKENAVDEHVKNEVQMKLEELAKLERPMPLAILQALWNPHTQENQVVLRQFLRKLSGTRRGLPKTSYFRALGVWVLKKVCLLLGCDTTVVTASSSGSLGNEVGLHHSQPQGPVLDSRAPSVQVEAGLDSALLHQDAWNLVMFDEIQ